MGYGLGLDLGTTRLKAAACHEGQVAMVQLSPWSVEAPALTRMPDRPVSTWVSGPGAMLDEAGGHLVSLAKRSFERGQPTAAGPGAAAIQALDHQLRWMFEASVIHLGGHPDHTVISHPSWWAGDLLQRLASSVADWPTPVSFKTDIEAAATTMTIPSEARGSVLADGTAVTIVDLGGGGTRVELLQYVAGQFHALGRPVADPSLAGIELVDAVAAHLARTRTAVADLATDDQRQIAVWALEQGDTSSTTPFLVPTADGGRSREALTTTDLADPVEAVTRGIVSHVGPLVAAGNTGHAPVVLLCGGMARFPAIADKIRSALGVPEAVAGDPAHTVARGAAHLASRAVAAPTSTTREATPAEWAIGVEGVDRSEGLRVDQLLRPEPEVEPDHAVEPDVSTVSRYRRPPARTFKDVEPEVEVDDGGVTDLPPDRRLAVIAAVVVALVVVVALAFGQSVVG